MAFFPYYNDLSPVFHLLDDYGLHRSSHPKYQSHNHHHRHQHQPAPLLSFSPKFDVRVMNDAFYLDGDLPGADQNNIEVEFSDPTTLVIKGRVERNYNNAAPAKSNQQTEDDEASSNNKSLQPTVEDEEEGNNSASMKSPTKSAEKTIAKENHKPSYKYQVSERSIGEFHRSFTFPTRVDQDAVSATLRNGILSLVLPKEPAPTIKKIRVE